MRAALPLLLLGLLACELSPARPQLSCEVDGDCAAGLRCEAGACLAPGAGEGEGERVRWPIVVDTAGIDEALVDFPLLVSLPARVDAAAFEAGGADLGFTLDGAPLAYELERWDPQGTSVAWVRIPSLPANATTTIYAQPRSGPGAGAVWDADYDGVWHLGDLSDSARGVDGASAGTSATPGVIGEGQLIPFGAGIDLGLQPDLLVGASAFTISAWLRVDQPLAAGATWGVVNFAIDAGGGGLTSGTTRFGFELSDAHAIRVIARAPDTDGGARLETAETLTTGEWHHVVVRVDIAGDPVDVLLDGAPATLGGYDFPSDALDDTFPANGAFGAADDLTGLFADGALDEIRISRIARSDAWLLASYRAMTGALVTLGDPEPF